jgi:hypothetical protein
VKKHYANDVEDQLNLTLTAMDFAEMVDIPNGTTKQIPRVDMRSTGDYTKYTDQTIAPIDTQSEDIVIDTTPMVNFAMDPIDEDDNYIALSPEVRNDAAYAIKARLDGAFFAEVSNAKWKYDDNGFGANDGTLTPIALVTGASQNYSSTFANAKAGLVSTGINASKLKLGVDPFVPAGLMTVGMETNGNVASESFSRGFKGTFGGMSVYESSTLTSEVVFDCATNPTAGDYVYIKGVKFEFVAVPATAGQVDIGASADATMANLILAINGTGTPGATTYIEVSGDDRARLEGTTAVDGTDLITITSNRGALMASSSMTAAANDFAAQSINAVLMEKGAIKLAMRGVRITERKMPLNLAVNTFIYARYGLKTTVRGAEKMCLISIQNKAAEA